MADFVFKKEHMIAFVEVKQIYFNVGKSKFLTEDQANGVKISIFVDRPEKCTVPKRYCFIFQKIAADKCNKI